MVKKTKLWRKTLPDKESSRVAAEALKEKSRPADFFLEDRTGQKEEVPTYPEKFAKQKFPPSKTPAEHFLSKKLPVKRPRADQSEMFDLWEEDALGGAPVGKSYENSHIPAVIRPHPGQSYRPDSTFHSNILEKVAQEEAVKEQDEIRHQEIINGFKVVDYDPSPEQSEDETPAVFVQNPPVKVKYLTNTQKNVKKRNQLKEKLKRIISQDKKSQKQFEQIPIIMKQLDNLSRKYKSLREEEKARKKMKIELEANGEIAPRIRMGKFRYKQPETVAALQPSDVLRKMTVKGSAVEERMDSLVRRKMVDLAKPRDPKKVYIKEYVNNEREQMIIESRSKQTSNQSAGHIPLKQI
jgi:hypothetical protein